MSSFVYLQKVNTLVVAIIHSTFLFALCNEIKFINAILIIDGNSFSRLPESGYIMHILLLDTDERKGLLINLRLMDNMCVCVCIYIRHRHHKRKECLGLETR